jgi:hypothetical protein
MVAVTGVGELDRRFTPAWRVAGGKLVESWFGGDANRVSEGATAVTVPLPGPPPVLVRFRTSATDPPPSRAASPRPEADQPIAL